MLLSKARRLGAAVALTFAGLSGAVGQVEVQVLRETVDRAIVFRRVVLTSNTNRFVFISPNQFSIDSNSEPKGVRLRAQRGRGTMKVTIHNATPAERAAINAIPLKKKTSPPPDALGGRPSRGGPALLPIKPKPPTAETKNKALNLELMRGFLRSRVLARYDGAEIIDQFTVHADRASGPGYYLHWNGPVGPVAVRVGYVLYPFGQLEVHHVEPIREMAKRDALVERILTSTIKFEVAADEAGKKPKIERLPGVI